MRSNIKKIIEVAVHMTLANDKDPFSLPEIVTLASDPILMFVNNKFIERDQSDSETTVNR